MYNTLRLLRPSSTSAQSPQLPTMQSVHVRNSSLDDAHLDSSDMLPFDSSNWKSAPRSIPTLFTKAPAVPAYEYDEDLISPIDEDSVSNHSTDDTGSTFSDISSIHSLDRLDDASVVSAQSIKIVTVGRPKVIDVPASLASSSCSYFDRGGHRISLNRPALERADHSVLSDASSLSIHDSILSATEHRAELAVPATPIVRNFSRRRPSLPSPLVSGLGEDRNKRRGNVFPATSEWDELPTPTRHSMQQVRTCQPTTSQSPLMTSIPSTPTTPLSVSWNNGRKLVKAAPIIKAIGNTIKQKTSKSSKADSLTRSQSVFITSQQDDAPLVLQPLPEVRRPKMQARGASERASAIELPPCPPGYEADIEFSDPAILQRELTDSSPRRSMYSDKRRRSIFS